MHKTLQQWVDELSKEVVTDHFPSVGEQGIANMVTIGVSDSSLKDWEKDSFREFILGCRDLYEKKRASQAMLFYSWYDEQAGQLRFSSISSEHNNPPFQCDIEYVELDFLIEKIYEDNGGLSPEGGRLYLWSSKLG